MKSLKLFALLYLSLVLFSCNKDEDPPADSNTGNSNNGGNSGSSLTMLPDGDQTLTGNLSEGEIL
jgi:hypothetical protein